MFRPGAGEKRKVWCDACGHWLEGRREDIKHHYQTPLHKRKAERKLKDQHTDARRGKVRAGVASGEDLEIPMEKTAAEKKKEEKKKKMKEAIKRMAEKQTKKRESDAALMAKSVSLKTIGGDGDQSKVWDIVIDDESGKACYMNKLSGEKKFEKPFGLKLTEDEQEFWDRCRDNVDLFDLRI